MATTHWIIEPNIRPAHWFLGWGSRVHKGSQQGWRVFPSLLSYLTTPDRRALEQTSIEHGGPCGNLRKPHSRIPTPFIPEFLVNAVEGRKAGLEKREGIREPQIV